jgi:valyl-tRNA synthetase
MVVAAERPAACAKCGGGDLRQEEDVLDTWFSSALWPFSTLGWPEQTPELARYYPTSLLITGFDIIFFWVARMMMMGLKCTGQVPFRDVYITPLVRDQYGKKMTKSRGNVVDPLQIMERYGTDAVRFTLAQLSVQGRDLILSDDRLAASRAFANKVWNAARFVLMNLEDAPQPIAPIETGALPLAERWILHSLDRAIAEVTAAIDRYEFNVAALRAYSFIWHEFCDWYIELAKEPLRQGGERQAAARWVLVRCFDGLLRLLHPFMPFITEEIWQALRPYVDERGLAPHLAIAKFPTPAFAGILGAEEAAAMDRCVAATDAINSLRSLLGYHPGQRVEARIKPAGAAEEDGAAFRAEFERWKPYAATMAKAASLGLAPRSENTPGGMVTAVLGWCEVSVMAPEGFDFERARAALRKKLDEVTAHHSQHQARLKNPDFIAKAAPEMQEQMQQRAQELAAQQELLCKQLTLLAEAG